MTNVAHINGATREPREVEPHQNVLFERSILGGLLCGKHPTLLGALPEFEVEDFYDWRHKIIFQAIRALEVKSQPIDTLHVTVEVARAEKLDAVGAGYLASLELEGFGTFDNLVSYAELLRVHRRNRDLQLILGKVAERARTWKHDPRDLLIETIGELQRLEGGTTMLDTEQRARWTIPLADFLGEREPDSDDAQDWIIRDIIPRAEAVLLGGPMKGGKTWTALDLCIAIATGKPWLGTFENTLGRPARVLGVFLEDNQRRLAKRIYELARSHGTHPNAEVLQEHLRLTRTPLRLPDATDQRRLVAEIKAWGAEFVALDNLTRVMVGDPNKTTDAAAFTRAWLEIVEETGASLMFLHHTRKPSGGGDQKQIDPFDTLRGSGDFGAAARNIIVTTPIRSEVENAAKLSEVRMRGNLDLRRESFTLGFERKEVGFAWRAGLADRGDIESIKSEVSLQNKSAKEAKKAAEYRTELDIRKRAAITLARAEKHITLGRLAAHFEKKAPNSMRPAIEALVRDKILVKCRDTKLGYELADEDRQERIP